jgi:hypothetical protein
VNVVALLSQIRTGRAQLMFFRRMVVLYVHGITGGSGMQQAFEWFVGTSERHVGWEFQARKECECE